MRCAIIVKLRSYSAAKETGSTAEAKKAVSSTAKGAEAHLFVPQIRPKKTLLTPNAVFRTCRAPGKPCYWQTARDPRALQDSFGFRGLVGRLGQASPCRRGQSSQNRGQKVVPARAAVVRRPPDYGASSGVFGRDGGSAVLSAVALTKEGALATSGPMCPSR